MIKSISLGDTNISKAYLGSEVIYSSPFDPLELFKGGKQGVWYDPSDKSTLFQDVAGTVPVTKDGDPAALMCDKSGNGNHATQTVSAARPIYRSGDGRGIVNTLLYTEELDTYLGWRKSRLTIDKESVVKPPIEGVNVFKLTANTNSGAFLAQRPANASQVATTISSIYVKAGTYSHVRISPASGPNASQSLTVDLLTGEYTHRQTIADASHSVEHVGDGWYRISTLMPNYAYAYKEFSIYLTSYNSGADHGWGLLEYAPDEGEYIYVAAPQYQLLPEDTTGVIQLEPYQANSSHIEGIATGKDTDRHWLEFDGVDDSFTLNFNTPVNPENSIYMGVNAEKLGVYPFLLTQHISYGRLDWLLRPSQNLMEIEQIGTKINTAFAFGSANVISVDSGSALTVRNNGVQTATAPASKVSLTDLFIGSQFGTGNYAKFKLYGMLVFEGGVYNSDADVYLANKSGVTL